MGKREDTEVKRKDDELDTRGKIMTRCRRDGSAEVPGRAGQRLLQRTDSRKGQGWEGESSVDKAEENHRPMGNKMGIVMGLEDRRNRGNGMPCSHSCSPSPLP